MLLILVTGQISWLYNQFWQLRSRAKFLGAYSCLLPMGCLTLPHARHSALPTCAPHVVHVGSLSGSSLVLVQSPVTLPKGPMASWLLHLVPLLQTLSEYEAICEVSAPRGKLYYDRSCPGTCRGKEKHGTALAIELKRKENKDPGQLLWQWLPVLVSAWRTCDQVTNLQGWPQG